MILEVSCVTADMLQLALCIIVIRAKLQLCRNARLIRFKINYELNNYFTKGNNILIINNIGMWWRFDL
jgi:hypothetical protein